MTEPTTTLESALHEEIRAAGLRLTLPRRAICAVLAANGEGFLSMGEILEFVEAEVGPIDPSTAYRTMEELARLGVVHHVHHGNQPGRWHLTMHHDHLHLVCERCGDTRLVPTHEIDSLLSTLRERYGFKALIHHFAVLGLCAECEADADHPHD